MSKRDDAKQIIAACCAGGITAPSALEELKQIGCHLPYPCAVTVDYGRATYFVNYSTTRTWAAYRPDGEHVGEWIDSKLQDHVEAAITQRRVA